MHENALPEMKCGSCQGTAEYSDLCGDCLVKIVEKRARKAIQNKSAFQKIAVVNDGSCEGEVNRYLAEKTLGKEKIEVSKEQKSRKEFVCVPDTADKTAERLIEVVLGPQKPLKKIRKK